MYIRVLGILVIGSVVVFSGAGFARAGEPPIRINEVLYDVKDLSDADHEWVEIYNTTSTPISLQGWKFNDGSNHTLNAPPANGGQGSLQIQPNEYAIITGNAATYLADHPGFSGTVIDTVMSLNNAGATLTIVNQSGAIIDTFTYTSSLGGNGTGQTLSRYDQSVIQATESTPGLVNKQGTGTNDPPPDTPPDTPPATDDSPTTDSGSTGSLSQQTGASAEPKSKLVPMKLTAIVPSKSTVGIPITIQVQAFGNRGEQLMSGLYKLNMGDGMSISKETSDELSYTYMHKGEYVILIEFYRYRDQKKPEITLRKTITVTDMQLQISFDDTHNVFTVSNTGSLEIDLYHWTLMIDGVSFTMINHSIILPKTITKIPGWIVSVPLQPQNRLQFLTTSGETIPVSRPVLESQQQTLSASVTHQITGVATSNSKSATTVESSPVKNTSKSTGTEKEKKPQESNQKQIPKKTLVMIGYGVVVLCGGIVLLFLQNKKREP